MGKKFDFQIPNPPTAPILVFDRYDRFYRDSLLRAIRDDFEQFPEGLPTYHSYLVRIVDKYAGNIVNTEDLDVRDLRNFLVGMNSQVKKVKILDAYIKVARPEKVSLFYPDKYVEYIGSAFGEYLADPTYISPGYDRAATIKLLCGVYKIRPDTGQHGRRLDDGIPRYLVIKQHSSSEYLITYEFSWMPKTFRTEKDDEFLKLATGYCIPQPISSFAVMRDFRYRYRHIGKIFIYKTEDHYGESALLTFNYTKSDSDLEPDRKRVE